MIFTFALCVLSIALAQSSTTTTASMTQAQAESASSGGAASTTKRRDIPNTSPTRDIPDTSTGISCADQVAVCQSRSKKCNTSLAVHCQCIDEERKCLTAAGNCTEATDGVDDATFTCFSLGCGIDCSGQAGGGGCNLASSALNCPNDRVDCMRKAETTAAKCSCEASYFKCVVGSRSCRDFSIAFEGKVAECKKICTVQECTIPSSGSTLALSLMAGLIGFVCSV
jgi:hypothetical protein